MGISQKIGLEAVLEMSNFNKGLGNFTHGIDNMVGQTERASGVFGKMGSVLSGMVKVGIGAAITGIGALTSVIAASIGPAAEAQAIEAQLDAVLKSTGKAAAEQAAAWEAAQGKTVTSTRLSAAALVELRQELTDTTLDYNTLGAEIQEQKQRIWEMTNVWTDQGLNVGTARAKLAEMENQYNKLGGTISTISGKIAKGGEKITISLAKKLGLVPPVIQMTKDELLALADALSQVTPYEDDLIISTEAILLQFQNIGKEVFPQAIEMTLDLAQRLGIDAVSAAKMLGKALVTPGEGLLRLKQAGVAFSDSQEKMIQKMVATGNLAGAQKLIMDELALSIGGAARAAGETFSGKMEILKNKIGNVQEAIGTAFMPLLTAFVDKFSAFVTKNGPAIAAFFENVARKIGGFVSLISDLVSGVVGLEEIEWRDYFPNWLADVISGTIRGLTDITTWLGTNIPKAITVGSAFWTNTLLPALVVVYDYIVTNIVPGFENAKIAIQKVTTEAVVPLSLEVGKLTSPMFTGLWDVITKKLGPALGDLFGWNKNVSQSLGNWLEPALKDTWKWMNDLWDKTKKDLGPALQWLDKNVLAPLKDTFEKVGEVIRDIIEWIKKLVAALDFDLPDILTPGSPTPFELGLRGIADAMRQVARDGMPALTFGMGSLTGMPGAGTSTSTTTSFGGDTYYVSVQDRLAAAVLISAARDRQLRRLAVGMGG